MTAARFTVITSTPEIFPSILASSVTGRAMKSGIWGLETINLRDFGHGANKKIDDAPFGGSVGMLARADVVADAIDYAIAKSIGQYRLIYMSPRGKKLKQPLVRKLAAEIATRSCNFIIICGRFEGVDQRILNYYPITEISIGDYIVTGGEIAAIVLIDAVLRYVPGVIGNDDSLVEESFSDDDGVKLEYDQYTRPRIWRGMEVPNVLLSGNHKAIKEWRDNK